MDAVPDDVLRHVSRHLDRYGDVIRMRAALRSDVPVYERPHTYLKTLYELESYTRNTSVDDPAYVKSLAWCERFRTNQFTHSDGWTDEQMRIITSEEDITMVQAFAGTGKTSTVIEYMRRRPEKKILYLAFNKAMEMSAKARVKDMAHVDVYTMHAYALEYLKNGHLPDDVVVGELRVKDLLSMYDRSTADDVSRELQAFCASDSSDVYMSDEYNETYKGYIAQQMQIIWKKMCKGEMRMSHDVYLKLFQLKAVCLPYDVIIVDEVQDCTPCQMSIVNRQSAKKIFVGDIHQQIYQFRGVCDPFVGSRVYTLTKTFRFGFEIADLCNHFLRTYKREENVVSTPKRLRSEVSLRRPVVGEKYTLICRSHVGVIEAASEIRQPMYFLGLRTLNIEKEVSIAEDLVHFENGRKNEIKHEKLRKVASRLGHGTELFRAFTDAYPDSSVWRNRLRLFEKHGERVIDMYRSIGEHMSADEDDAIVTITNVHQAKGLEFETVVLHGDFANLCVRDPTDGRWVARVLPLPVHVEGYNLIYVAMTRAMKKLVLNEQLVQFVHTLRQWGHPFVQRTCTHVCCGCRVRGKCYEVKCSNDPLGTSVSEYMRTRFLCATCFSRTG
jgi:hypothetical protein